MSGWTTLHAILSEENEMTVEKAEEYLSNRGCSPNVGIYRDSGKMHVTVGRGNEDTLEQFASIHARDFEVVGIGRGNDTGPGSDRVKFYDVVDASLEEGTRWKDCPIAYNGLRVEATR